MNRILAPNLMVGVLSFFAIVGITLAITGITADLPWARKLSFFLIAPLIVTGILLVLVGFPILVVANRKGLK